MIYNIAYNSQRDNDTFQGKFPGYAQCFSTCAWMLMSYYCKDIIATDDKTLAKYIDDVEFSVGSVPGLAEQLKERNPNITGRSSLFWDVQWYGIQTWLRNKKVQGNAFVKLNAPFESIRTQLESGPIIIGTNKFGTLPGGHIILGIGYDDENIICNDPYGNANDNYTNVNGSSVYYKDSFLRKYFTNRVLYWTPV